MSDSKNPLVEIWDIINSVFNFFIANQIAVNCKIEKNIMCKKRPNNID